MKLPKHMSCHIYHNNHKNYYQNIKEYLDQEIISIKYLSKEEIEEIIQSDEIWEIQLYPISPISFHHVCAPSFEKALEKICKEFEEKENVME